MASERTTSPSLSISLDRQHCIKSCAGNGLSCHRHSSGKPTFAAFSQSHNRGKAFSHQYHQSPHPYPYFYLYPHSLTHSLKQASKSTQASKSKQAKGMTRLGFDPRTLSVLRIRDNQLHHPAVASWCLAAPPRPLLPYGFEP